MVSRAQSESSRSPHQRILHQMLWEFGDAALLAHDSARFAEHRQGGGAPHEDPDLAQRLDTLLIDQILLVPAQELQTSSRQPNPSIQDSRDGSPHHGFAASLTI